MHNTIIIGGGASGLFLGANLKNNNNLLLESQKALGNKILISGGGMCNLTNTDSPDVFLRAFGGKDKENFLKPSIYNLDPKLTVEFFKSLGLNTVTRDDGKIFPESLSARSIVDVLAKKARENTTIFTGSKVLSVTKTDDEFTVKTENILYKCKNLVIATGGLSFPSTGSDGSGLEIAKKLGHRIITPTPSLTGLVAKNYLYKSLAGSSIKNCQVDFYHNLENKRYLRANGDLLFTHRGISGPVILNNSRFIQDDDKLVISLVPCNNREELRQEIIKVVQKQSNSSVTSILKDLGLTKSFANFLASKLELSTPNPKKITSSLLETEIIVQSKIGFNAAMATAGGIDLKEVNRKNMESKIITNLFFTGEVLDIDGNTGGYNIQAAFSTARLVADYLNNNTN